MKILVNATNTRIGGGVQKSVEFVRASLTRGTSHEYFFVLADVVEKNLEGVARIEPDRLMVAARSPSHPVRGRDTRRALREAERRFRPDVVYTVFGPTYTTFRAPHLLGFAVPWVTHPNAHAWRTIRSPLSKARFWAWCRYVAYWARFADRWVTETNVSADGLARVLGVDRSRVHVVPNVAGGIYETNGHGGAIPGTEKRDQSDFNVLVFSHWYPHKNLEILPQVAAEVSRRDPSRRYRFFLTFDRSLEAWRRIQEDARRRGVEASVVNLGPILVGDGPALYGASDAVFLPTVLETYTATYPEAMACRKPLVTTDLPFARDICGDAALYAPPDHPAEAASRIVELAGSETLRATMVERGVRRLRGATTRERTYEMLLEALEITAQVRGR